MTLDNVFISNSKVTFFDWEHFSVNGELWGFDIAYLILSAAFLPYYSKGEIPSKDKLVLKELWKKLCSFGLSNELTKAPLYFFRNRFTSGEHWSTLVSHSPKKLFPIWSNEEFINYLHNIIS